MNIAPREPLFSKVNRHVSVRDTKSRSAQSLCSLLNHVHDVLLILLMVS